MRTPPLQRLLRATSEAEREAAWADFLSEHSGLILHTARRASRDHDDVMDRYTEVLARLREDDFKRLRAYSLNGTGKFTTWLVVIVRRLCIDHHRRVFGRSKGRPDAVGAEGLARRNLATLVAADVEPDQLVDVTAESADVGLVRRERADRLQAALAELEVRDQLLLTLRYVDELSPERVARIMGYASRFAVRRRLKILLGLLRRRLRSDGWGP